MTTGRAPRLLRLTSPTSAMTQTLLLRLDGGANLRGGAWPGSRRRHSPTAGAAAVDCTSSCKSPGSGRRCRRRRLRGPRSCGRRGRGPSRPSARCRPPRRRRRAALEGRAGLGRAEGEAAPRSRSSSPRGGTRDRGVGRGRVGRQDRRGPACSSRVPAAFVADRRAARISCREIEGEVDRAPYPGLPDGWRRFQPRRSRCSSSSSVAG